MQSSTCRKGSFVEKEAVFKNPHSTSTKKMAAEKIFHSLTDRVKERRKRKHNVELFEMAAKDASQFWRVFKTLRSNACPVELSAQFEAFRTLMGAEPPVAPGVSTHGLKVRA